MAGVTDKIKNQIAKLADKTTHLDVAKATQSVAKKLGLSERLVNYTHIEIRNRLSEYGFKATPYNKRILFLPHCLRDSEDCKAKSGEEGLECERCGKCDITNLIALAEDNGYQGVFVAPGGSMVQKLTKKYKPAATVGVCCYHEANLAFDHLAGTGIHPQVVLLLHDGCKDTKANAAEVREKMELIDPTPLNKKKS